MKKEMKYEEALAQLEDIVGKMEEGQQDIDTLGEQLQKAKELIKFCKDRLTKTDEEIQKIMQNE